MNCERVQNLLGRFRDGELSPPERASVAAHLETCPACAAEFAAITELGEMVRTWGESELPGDLWDQIARRLAATGPGRNAPSRPTVRAWKAVVLAALVLVAVATGWLAHQPRLPSDDPAGPQPTVPVVDLTPYLGPQFSAVPRQGQPLRPEETARHIGFRVLTAPTLPEGYSLKESYLVRIEGCKVVQYKYLRGSDVALLLQYSQGQEVTYGGYPVVAVRQVNGKPVQIAQGDGHLAASWEANGTAVSLVGPRDQSELVRLVAYVDQRLAEDKK